MHLTCFILLHAKTTIPIKFSLCIRLCRILHSVIFCTVDQPLIQIQIRTLYISLISLSANGMASPEIIQSWAGIHRVMISLRRIICIELYQIIVHILYYVIDLINWIRELSANANVQQQIHINMEHVEVRGEIMTP